METLQNMCINNIIEKDLNYTNKIPKHIEQEIDFTKHKNNMKKTFGYFNNIQKWINDNPDVIIKNVRYLPSQDFFSYDHLLIRYSNTVGLTSFHFLQM